MYDGGHTVRLIGCKSGSAVQPKRNQLQQEDANQSHDNT
jgi:hypothetical protein